MAQPTEAAAFEMHSPTQPVTELAAIARETSRDKVTMKPSLSMIVAEGREVIGLVCLKIEGQDIGGLYPLASNRYWIHGLYSDCPSRPLRAVYLKII